MFDVVRSPLSVLSLAVLLAQPAASAAPAAPPVDAFFQNVELSSAAISPDGRHVIARAAYQGLRRSLVVFDLATMQARVLARYANGDVGSAEWLNDRRIAFNLVNIDAGTEPGTAGMYAVDLDGKEVKPLRPSITGRRSFAQGEPMPGPQYAPSSISGAAPQVSDNVYVIGVGGDQPSFGSMNSRTANVRLASGPDGTFNWLIDETEKLRMTVSRHGGRHTLHQRVGNDSWRDVVSFDPASEAALMPRLYLGDALYVQARNGGDRLSLYRYDVERAAVDGAPLVTSPEFDIEARPVTEGKRLLGVRINTDGEDTVWFDPAMKALQDEVDALLPQTANQIARGLRTATPFVLVTAYSPTQPGDILVYNRATKALAKLGSYLPRIVPAQMAPPLDMVRYKARDGLPLSAYVTLPKAEIQKNLPTVILVGAQPWSRNGAWAFDPAVQFLASRGYAVIQPDTRGAHGFGAARVNAGKRQWGLAMQDDLADSARWAIDQGIADPKRICIAGTVYGGYAALMGLIKDPDLFKCAVSWSGMTDLKAMFGTYWKKEPATPYGDELKALVGDPDKDQAQLGATSPLQQAKRLKRPVLLAYGASDDVVPAEQGRLLYEAIKGHNREAEWLLFDQPAASLEKNRIALWTRIELFLARQIGTP